ncbi:conserved hypothetical protein [Culex quinquefasciatus]|uniref:Uncharacterized protein n=1 Tax=Culex quinquefasciatus TaxID=7176 RepID=B0X784_CULQU|nr:conserved hypothetical protein [Culex quinquefasciatus]|eukprot:XP_001865506.1 conserved hypothetical protein [Culex quinquefasciatus]
MSSSIADQSVLTECHLEALKRELGFREQIATFLVQTDLVGHVQQVCAEFYRQYLAEHRDRDLLLKPLIVRLPLQYESLAKFDPSLLRTIIEAPIYFEQALQEVVLSVVNAHFAQLEPVEQQQQQQQQPSPYGCSFPRASATSFGRNLKTSTPV